MKKRAPQLLIIAGAILLVIAGVTIIYNLVDDYLAGQRAQLVLEELREIPSPAAYPPDVNSVIDYVAPSALAEAADELDSDETAPAPKQTESSAEPAPKPNYSTAGVLSIAKLKLELPVLSEWSDSLLKISICMYKGDAQEKPQRLVIAGHNYKSHFGRLPKLELGDQVCFTNQNGAKYFYAVSEITEIANNDHYALEQGEWDIALFTCTPDGNRRILVRCQEEGSLQTDEEDPSQPD